MATVIIPALNEKKTIGHVVRLAKNPLHDIKAIVLSNVEKDFCCIRKGGIGFFFVMAIILQIPLQTISSKRASL